MFSTPGTHYQTSPQPSHYIRLGVSTPALHENNKCQSAVIWGHVREESTTCSRVHAEGELWACVQGD